MIKKTKKHTIYEVLNEYTCESVFVDHKPTKKEIIDICNEEWEEVGGFTWTYGGVEEYIKKYIWVGKVKRFYTGE